MEITAVEKRRKSLCAIYIDGEYALDLDKNVTLEHALNPGQQITDEELYAKYGLSEDEIAFIESMIKPMD